VGLNELGLDVGKPRTPEDLAESLAADDDRNGAVLKSIGFKPE
jgi:hypothetical protein